jgi:hypothetical protein
MYYFLDCYSVEDTCWIVADEIPCVDGIALIRHVRRKIEMQIFSLLSSSQLHSNIVFMSPFLIAR